MFALHTTPFPCNCTLANSVINETVKPEAETNRVIYIMNKMTQVLLTYMYVHVREVKHQ